MSGQRSPYVRAREYLFAQGRELDQQRFLFRFEDGNREAVLDALEKYQNEDGGFGHALEPDIRTTASSVIATTHGFEVLREVGAPSSLKMVQNAGEFMRRQYDPQRKVWPIVPPEVEDAPHAPWWTYTDTEENFGGFGVNPRAAVVGYLLEHPALANGVDVSSILAEVVADVQEQELDMHEILCVFTLLDSPGLPGAERRALSAAIRSQLPNVLLVDPAKWDQYGLLPLDVVRSPESEFADVVPDALVARHLDRLLKTQEPDGSWPIPWSWAFVSESAWAQAERDWKGYLAVEILSRLKAHGRL